LIIGTSKNADTVSDKGEDDYAEVERLCNLGAAELLMPGDLLLKRATEIGIGPKALELLYDLCLVSYEALLFRLAEIIPSSAMVFWRNYARKPDEEPALRVLTSYQRYDKNAHAPWLPKGSTSKRIEPNIVEKAAQFGGSVYADSITLSLNGKAAVCMGVASTLPNPRRDVAKLPLFHGKRIYDEQPPKIDVILLVALRAMDARPDFWKSLSMIGSD